MNNTYEQDKTIPIYIILRYDRYVLKFPVNPDSIQKDIASNSTTEEIEGIGQISTQKKPDLAKITIKSFFWQDRNAIPSYMYVAWIEKWQKSLKPADLIVTRLNYSMQVTCESFSPWINAGEEEDIYFSLELLEYRPHGAKKLSLVTNETLIQAFSTITQESASPILIDVPSKSRSASIKESYTNPYTVLQGETLSTITRKITGTSDDWQSLYTENEVLLGNIFSSSTSSDDEDDDSGNEIPRGTKLTLPDDWIDNASYNILNTLSEATS